MSFILSCTFSASSGDDECSRPSSLQNLLTLSLSSLPVQSPRARPPFVFEFHQSTPLGFRGCGEKTYCHGHQSRTHLAVVREQTLLYDCHVVLEVFIFHSVPDARDINEILG